MKQFALLISFFILATSFTADAQVRELENFNNLQVNDGITVQLNRGERNSAKVIVSSGNVLDVRTSIQAGVLRINWKEGVDTNNRSATVDLYYTEISTIKVNAGSILQSKQIVNSKDLKLSCTAGSKLVLKLDCDILGVDCNSGASISLSGKTGTQEVEVTSGASYKAEDLVSETANIEASTGASAIVHASKTINAEATSGASIKYTGSPTNKEIQQSKISGGSVKSF